MVSNADFGKFIRELRKEKQMTQMELAKILNISDKTVSKWEQGKAFHLLPAGLEKPHVGGKNLFAECNRSKKSGGCIRLRFFRGGDKNYEKKRCDIK